MDDFDDSLVMGEDSSVEQVPAVPAGDTNAVEKQIDPATVASSQQGEVDYSGLKLPDDATNVEATEETMGGFKALAKELNLSQEQAQKVVEFGAKTMHKAIGDGMEAIKAQVEEMKRKWHSEASNDPAVKADLPFAKRVVNRFRDDEFIGMLNETGVGSHKAMIKFLINVGKAMGEAPLLTDGIGVKGAGGEDFKSLANSVYKDKM